MIPAVKDLVKLQIILMRKLEPRKGSSFLSKRADVGLFRFDAASLQVRL